MNVDVVTQLHDAALGFVKIGQPEAALRVLRDVLQQLKTHEAYSVIRNDSDDTTARPRRQTSAAVVHIFPVSCEQGCSELLSMSSFSLFQPWEVFCEISDYEAPLSYPETMFFISATLYNIGICYQILCFQRAKSHYRDRAKRVYEIALRTLEGLLTNSDFKATVHLLGASIANNLAVIFADTYQRAQLARCIDILEVYAQNLDWTWNWIYYNLFEWRTFEARHAALA